MKLLPAFINHLPMTIVWFILILLLLLSILFGATLGNVTITLPQVCSVIAGESCGAGTENLYDRRVGDIVWELRLPRLVLAAAAGTGLTVSGIVMQAIVQNPLAEPYLLGISSGASLGAVCAIFMGIGAVWGENALGLCAFLGALLVSALVLFMAHAGGRSHAIKLLLAGMALNAASSAYSGFIVFIGSNKDGMQSVTYWLMGSVANAQWSHLPLLLFVIAAGTLFFWTQSRILNLMLLGDDAALVLGTDIKQYKNLYVTITSLIVGLVVYNAGMIGFVGLMVPHIVRTFAGTNHKYLIPFAALLGAILLVWTDIACRMAVRGLEFPLGVMAALMGAPLFIYLMMKQAYRFGGRS